MRRKTVTIPDTTTQRKVLSKAVVNTAEKLEFTKNKLSRVLGISPATVTRLYTHSYELSPDRKEWDFGVLLVRLFRSLDALVGGSREDALAWMNSKNKGLADQKPADLIEKTEGLFSGTVWRMVESQYESSTMRLVDTIREHEILEDILEASKPPIPDEAKDLHYLLFSPFRYAHTTAFGTRFRAQGDPGVFYSADTPYTAASEVGYWHWKFVQDSDGLKRLSPSQFTAFSVPLSDLSVDLRIKPFKRDAVRWQHPSDYTATQAFARIVRETNVGIIMYKSVRCPIDSFCAAVLDPKAFAQKKPDTGMQSWVLSIADEVIWSRNQGEESFSLTF